MAAAHADLITPLVELHEKVINDADGNRLMNQYVVTNNSSRKQNDIDAFAVSNPAAIAAWTTREGWSVLSLSRNNWNAMDEYAIYLGSFESLFGTEDNYVNYFSSEESPIHFGSTADGFYFSAPPTSEYVAFGINGGVFY